MSEPQKLTLAVPSKGRLMERTLEYFADAGLEIKKSGSSRGYRGEMPAAPEADVVFMSASEIASALHHGRIHLGVTGEDLINEEAAEAKPMATPLKPLGFGEANVVVAVPKCWVDVRSMRDLGEVGFQFRKRHQRRMRVATKYTNTTRRYFTEYGIADYRIVESLGATEGTPASGTAELIVDITSTGATLAANALKILDDGVILTSEATLFAAKDADWPPHIRATENEILGKLGL
ncbi:MAG: ATP phosphoribosyltransferase [Pseudomonadota bacterium]